MDFAVGWMESEMPPPDSGRIAPVSLGRGGALAAIPFERPDRETHHDVAAVQLAVASQAGCLAALFCKIREPLRTGAKTGVL